MRHETSCLFLRRLGFPQIDAPPPAGMRSEVVRRVAARHGLTPRDLKGYLPRNLVPVRDEAVWWLRQTRTGDACPNSYPTLAIYFGLTHHTSIMAAERRHQARMRPHSTTPMSEE